MSSEKKSMRKKIIKIKKHQIFDLGMSGPSYKNGEGFSRYLFYNLPLRMTAIKSHNPMTAEIAIPVTPKRDNP